MTITTTAAKKAPLWTKTQLDAIENGLPETGKYDNDSVAELLKGELFSGKNQSQLRGKIVNLGYYKAAKKIAVGTTGETPQRKMAFVNTLEIIASMPVGALASFEKASKPQLEALVLALTAKSTAEELANES